MAEEPQQTIISVVGMGGSGKTTLVANTFNKQKHYWRLVQFLQSRRYLVVLDEVWSNQFWQEISIAFPEGMCGSRVMATTRREDVAPFQPRFVSYVHRILPLRDNDAWEFFCKKAFPNELGQCLSHLDSLARNLVEKCGMKSSKKSIAEWKRVRDNLAWELSNNPSLELMRTILLHSYHKPPFQLKHCSLYCSLLPEDYEIRRNRISRLWMAGVLEMGNDILPEAVAKSYLMELISRNFALSISKEESFLAACDGEKGEEQRGNHRCSIQVKDKEIKTGNVLDLEDAPVDELPSEFGHLLNLRYLNLSKTQGKKLPNEIVKLQNLRQLSASYLTKRELKYFLEEIWSIVVPQIFV
ncbi:hypothetical protein V6Z11_D09G120500 [Gossypium hirsutum]